MTATPKPMSGMPPLAPTPPPSQANLTTPLVLIEFQATTVPVTPAHKQLKWSVEVVATLVPQKTNSGHRSAKDCQLLQEACDRANEDSEKVAISSIVLNGQLERRLLLHYFDPVFVYHLTGRLLGNREELTESKPPSYLMRRRGKGVRFIFKFIEGLKLVEVTLGSEEGKDATET